MKKEKVIVTSKTTELVCDFCGVDEYEGGRIRSCYICEKDVCTKCAVLFDLDYSLLKPRFYSDYPTCICKNCWDIGESIRNTIEKVRDEAGDKESELWDEWRKKING